MADWYATTTLSIDDQGSESVACGLYNWRTQEREDDPMLMRGFLGKMEMTAQLVRQAGPPHLRWLWRPYIALFCGMAWLVGPRNIMRMTHAVWIANIITVFCWLATWGEEHLHNRVLWPCMQFLWRRGVLNVPETQPFEMRKLWTYLTDRRRV